MNISIKGQFRILLCCALAVTFLLSGCNGKSNKPSALKDFSADRESVQAVTNAGSDQQRMLEVIEAYYDIYNELFLKNEEGIRISVEVSEDGTLNINRTKDGQTDTVISWPGIEEGYAYLYEQQQIDIEGNILIE